MANADTRSQLARAAGAFPASLSGRTELPSQSHPRPAVVGDRLLAAGMPVDIVRATVLALTSEEAHCEALAAAIAVGYWRPRYESDRAYAETVSRYEQFREALAADPRFPQPIEEQLARERRYGPLSAAKYAAVHRIWRDFGDLGMRFSASGSSQPDLALRQRLDDQQRAELSRVLTPAELEELELRHSGTYCLLKTAAGGLPLTAEEFRAIFRLIYPVPVSDREVSAEITVVLGSKFSGLAAILGEQRAFDLLAAYDFSVRWVRDFGQPRQLTRQAQITLVLIGHETTARAAAIKVDRTFSPVARRDAHTALIQASEAKIAALLSPVDLAAYRRHDTGHWLRVLKSEK